jgi:hypothetical protein
MGRRAIPESEKALTPLAEEFIASRPLNEALEMLGAEVKVELGLTTDREALCAIWQAAHYRATKLWEDATEAQRLEILQLEVEVAKAKARNEAMEGRQ